MALQDFMSKDLKHLEEGALADATITCGDKVWNVHKIIIYRCEWFKKAFNGNFEEAKTNNVNISSEDFSEELVDAVITFIYSGSVDIEKLNTNNSVVDTCVRLWVIADFFVLKELQNQAIKLLENHLDNNLQLLCVMDKGAVASDMSDEDYGAFLNQTFAGIWTAYITHPHSLPCQEVLVSFFHATRNVFFSTFGFTRVMSSAPHDFSHALLMATVDGKQSKWVLKDSTEFGDQDREDTCTSCGSLEHLHQARWAIDPSISGRTVVHWRCIPCHEKRGSETT